MKEYISNNEEQTKEVAKEFIKTISGGDIVLLEGDLGAGKTAFVKGVVEALGGDGLSVTSPTFTIVNEYNLIDVTIYHFDLYRINSVDELYNIGIEEYLYSDKVCFVEWPERAEELFNENCKKIYIYKIGENSRRIVLE